MEACGACWDQNPFIVFPQALQQSLHPSSRCFVTGEALGLAAIKWSAVFHSAGLFPTLRLDGKASQVVAFDLTAPTASGSQCWRCGACSFGWKWGDNDFPPDRSTCLGMAAVEKTYLCPNNVSQAGWRDVGKTVMCHISCVSCSLRCHRLRYPRRHWPGNENKFWDQGGNENSGLRHSLISFLSLNIFVPFFKTNLLMRQSWFFWALNPELCEPITKITPSHLITYWLILDLKWNKCEHKKFKHSQNSYIDLFQTKSS